MFAKLAFKNMKRSIKDYAIYFLTLVLGVAIFYIFNAIDSQTAMMNINQSLYDIVDMMMTIMSVVSIFVALVLGFLILYASRFLIKRRSKELGLYLTLGMSKRKISKLLLLETFFIGLLSLVVGLIVGIALSQLTSVLVANMFEADLTNYAFVFSTSACIKTLICFGIIYFIVMIFNTININRQKLINLLSSSRQNEKIKIKNLWVSTFVFIISVCMLAWAYYAVTGGVTTILEDFSNMVWIVLATGGVATFLLFWSLSGLLLRIFTSWKKVYYHGLNSFTLRQFSSKINTTVMSMTVICLMLFVTICVFSSAMSIRNSMNETARQSLPLDVEFTEAYRVENSDQDGDSVSVVVQSNREKPVQRLDIKEFYQTKGVDIDEIFAAYTDYVEYTVPSWELSDSLGDAYEEISLENPKLYFDRAERLIKQSDYNALAKLFNIPEVNLANDEYAVLANYDSMVKIRNRGLATQPIITVFGQTLKPKYNECIIGKYHLTATANDNDGIIIVPDSLQISGERYYTSYAVAKYNPDLDSHDVDAMIQGPWEDSLHNQEYTPFFVETRQDIIDNSVGLGAMVTFIGLYLGLVFLISSAAVLALKELSESTDSRQKFDTLRRIGASEKMLNRALFWQIAIFFGFPLLIAIIHAIFGMMFCNFVLEAFGNMYLIKSIFMTAAFIIIIYGGYFLLTYFCSKGIIRERRD